MKMRDARITWNKDSNEVYVTPLKYWEPPESKKCRFSSGACFVDVRDIAPDSKEAESIALRCALHCLITYRVEPLAVLKAFMEIDEFRATMDGYLFMGEEEAMGMLKEASRRAHVI